MSAANTPTVRRSRPRHPAGLGALTLLLGLALRTGAQTVPSLPPASTLKQLSVEQLMDIEVTSVSRRPEKLFAAASGIQVVTSEDIRRAGATSLPEALRLASNLEVAQIDARQWAISARGFNNLFADKMLVLIDGRSVYTPLYAGVYWDVQDTLLTDLDRIEVISGPGATQWGANAVNGVINVTSKDSKDTQGGLVEETVGSELRNRTAVRYGGRLSPHLTYRVYAKYFDRGDSIRPDHRDGNDAWHMSEAGFRSDWAAANDNTVTFQGDAYVARMGQPGPDTLRANGRNLLGRWVHEGGAGSEVKLQAYYDHTHRRIPNSFTQDIDTYDVDFQHRLPLGTAQDFLWGIGFRSVDDAVVNTPANAFLPPHVIREWFNAFLQDEITLRPGLHLTAGTKLEHNDYTGFEAEPSGRLAWLPTRTQTVWAAVSRALRTPSRIDRDLYSPATPPYRIAGGQKVVSEKLLAFELGYRAQLDPRLALSVSTFYNRYDDLRSLEPLNPPAAFPVEQSSGLRGRSYGVETAVDYRVSARWKIHAGYTELRVHSEPQSGTLDRGTRDSIVRDPLHQLALRSSFDLSPHWEADLSTRYVSAIDSQHVPGYAEADARLGWNPSDAWEFSLEGQNLLHSHHPEFNSPGSRRELQRAGYARATWRF